MLNFCLNFPAIKFNCLFNFIFWSKKSSIYGLRNIKFGKNYKKFISNN
ncbi:hypothetical protein HMP0015_1782 [Acinetobacter haemolyticus ATCC 19194]|uniref:Uncharacterized protein n=1 Tax=Acinetobacter haemolyticus ATCC 19194 TaxID=707232 RepID=D4XPZ0_ACIHA|nr:hypothetical protein HMP0015_1782 [Acinetobacter haemolyticus ATCC 19194]